MSDDERGQGDGGTGYARGRRHEVDARLGCVHEARNVTTDTPGLTLVPSGDVEWRPAGPCALRLSYAPEQGAVTVDVERAPAPVRTSELTNLLVLATAMFKRVEDDEAVEAHLASGPVRRATPARQRQTWAARGALVAVGLSGLAMGLGVCLVVGGSSRSDATDCTWAIGDALMRETDFVARNTPDMEAIAYPLPEKPWTKQAVAPCETEKGEVEINKGCWVELARKPPCFPKQAEHQGKCYMPVRKTEPMPQSAEP